LTAHFLKLVKKENSQEKKSLNTNQHGGEIGVMRGEPLTSAGEVLIDGKERGVFIKERKRPVLLYEASKDVQGREGLRFLREV